MGNSGEIVVTSFKEHARARGQQCIYMYTFESKQFPFFAVTFYNNQIISATESESTGTSKEDNCEMCKRKFDLEDDEEKHSSEGANTLDNMPKRTKMNLLPGPD